jgi:hypothetical protein
MKDESAFGAVLGRCWWEFVEGQSEGLTFAGLIA